MTAVSHAASAISPMAAAAAPRVSSNQGELAKGKAQPGQQLTLLLVPARRIGRLEHQPQACSA